MKAGKDKGNIIDLVERAIRRRKSLRNANLYCANLQGANLRNADLCGANLRGANLQGADLSGADLYGAYLNGADLQSANLSGTNLQGANLRRANLQVADLQGANLCEVDLQGANLQGAYLRNANLYGANLRGADLSGAFLNGASLQYADLRGADLYGANLRNADLYDVLYDYMTVGIQNCPDGELVGYKAVGNYIIKLIIPKPAKRSRATTNKCRCSKAIVESIIQKYTNKKIKSITNNAYGRRLIYSVGETVYPDSWDDDRWNECSNGIHFFLDEIEARNYDN